MTLQDAVYFPPIVNNTTSENTVARDQADSFEMACQEAIERKVPLILSQNVVLSQTIHLKGQQHLHIIGSHDGTLTPQPPRVTIEGALHSLFLLNNKNQLIVEHVNLDHTLQTDDHKQVGAAINTRGKSRVTLKHSNVSSVSGFCVWAIQNSRVVLDDCHFLATTRSALVCFGQTTCQVYRCHVDHAGVHGLCARGTCRITMVDCRITHSAARAIYAYANASVVAQGCHVSGTLHPDKAAIEVSTMKSITAITSEPVLASSSSSLVLQDCQIVDNQGVGVRIRGPVVYEERGVNLVERNVKGDWDICLDHDDESASNPPLTQGEGVGHTTTSSSTGLPPLRRDAKGSSFRRGDWLCSKCFHIVAAGRPNKEDEPERCSHCSSQRSSNGEDRLLTAKEIRECNMGIDIRQGWVLHSPSALEADGTSIVIWEFDGDDEKGWISYDDESSQLLEAAHQRRVMPIPERIDDDYIVNSPLLGSQRDTALLVHLQGRKYQVNLATMVQINVETQFPRFVRRRTCTSLSQS